MQHEKSHHGIDWEAIAKGSEKELNDAVSKAQERLHEIRRKMSDKEVEGAKSMGLLTSNGVQQILLVLQTSEMNRDSNRLLKTHACNFSLFQNFLTLCEHLQ